MLQILKLVAQRLALGLLTLFMISLIIFLCVEMLPGNFSEAILGQAATPETVAAFNRELGLDLPPHERYFTWLLNMMQGDFGHSLASKRELSELLGYRLENTLFLASVAAAIANYQPHRPRPRNLDGLAKNVRLAPNGKYKWHWDPNRRKSQGAANPAYRQRLHDCADKLTLPTLLVRGGLSDVLSDEGAQSFLAQCPHAEYVAVENAAHMVAGDRNDIFAGSVIEFLGRVAPV